MNHNWVAGGMYVHEEDLATIGRKAECQTCGVTYGSVEYDPAQCGVTGPAETTSDVPHLFRGRMVVAVATEDVRVGDVLCHWLSDASAYTPVTGWADHVLCAGTPYETTHRVFTVTGAPWWVERSERTAALTGGDVYGRVHILARPDMIKSAK